MKRYEFDIGITKERWEYPGTRWAYRVNVPTTANELERLILNDLVENDPLCQDARTLWQDLKIAEGSRKAELAQKIYQVIFGKMNTYYWQHNYGAVVFALVRGMIETVGVDPDKELLDERIRTLPRNNYDGSGLDCTQRCHEKAARLLYIAFEYRDPRLFSKVQELKGE